MMDWLLSIDTDLFRFINHSLVNPVFDWIMPRMAGHPLFLPVVLLAGFLLLWKGGRRGRIFVLLLAMGIGLTDGIVCNSIKKLVGRPRPCAALADTRALIGCGQAGSMPSSHAANWSAAAVVFFVFYRRSWRVMAPMAATMAFSRVYNGVHYPSDVVAGVVLGAGSAAAAIQGANVLWGWTGRRWFPFWWQSMPSLICTEARAAPSGSDEKVPGGEDAGQWLRLGYVVIATSLVFRLAYIGSGTIELSKDEAYQWLWSKHLALSYYSKPPGIALIQFAGTHLWRDTTFGVRFFSPMFAALLSLVMLRFMAREVGARQGFLLLLIVTCAPLMSLGTILMTIDPPLVLCWTLAMIAGWRAIQPDGRIRHWLLAGVAAGLGFLSKYTALYLVVCWALFFLLWKPARVHLRKPGPYLLLLVLGVSTIPVILWNSQHDWITAQHVAHNAGMEAKWKPTLRFFGEFLGIEAGLLNPVFFVGASWAMAGFWKRYREHPLWLYFFCMGWPVFLAHVAWSFHSRIQPNWVAPAVVPMFCLMVAYWHARWSEGCRGVSCWLGAGLAIGAVAAVFLHQSNLIGQIIGHPLPAERDPLRRVRAWKETTALVNAARLKLAQEGKPTFIIADHYGMAGQFTFYLPEARSALSAAPLVYPRTTAEPNNQLYFWPEYRYRNHRAGQNAIYVTEPDPYPLEKGWLWKWLKGQPVSYAEIPPPIAPPPMLLEEFSSVVDLGVQEVKLGRRVFRRVQLFECRDLR